MKRLGILVLLAAVGLTMTLSDGEAAWKKRGWYMKKQGVTCVMRKVTVVSADGKVVVQQIRVCG